MPHPRRAPSTRRAAHAHPPQPPAVDCASRHRGPGPTCGGHDAVGAPKHGAVALLVADGQVQRAVGVPGHRVWDHASVQVQPRLGVLLRRKLPHLWRSTRGKRVRVLSSGRAHPAPASARVMAPPGCVGPPYTHTLPLSAMPENGGKHPNDNVHRRQTHAGAGAGGSRGAPRLPGRAGRWPAPLQCTRSQ